MGRSSINVKRLVMWPLLTDTAEGTTYGETPRAFTNELNSAKYSPKTQTAEQYGDGVRVEDYIAKDGGDLNIVIRGFTSGDYEFLFGETNENGTAVSSANDIVPYNCVAYATERPDGKLNLFKFPKTKFMSEGEDAKQKEGTSISYNTASLKGTYSPLISTGADCYKRIAVDPETESALIEAWFTDAAYYKPEGTLGSLTVTSAAGTNTGDTKLTVTPAKSAGNSYKYKAAATAPTVGYMDDVSAWDSWNGTDDLTIAAGQKVTVVEANSSGKALKSGSATVTARS